MIDFSQLKVPTAAERALDDAARQERFFKQDDVERDFKSKKALTLTLTHEPEIRGLPNGDRVVLLRGSEDGRNAVTAAAYIVPPRATERVADRDALDDTLRDMSGGDRVSLAGQWAKRIWSKASGEKVASWEFKTQHFEKGDHSLGEILEKARERREGVAPSQTEQDRSSIVARAAAAGRGTNGMGA